MDYTTLKRWFLPFVLCGNLRVNDKQTLKDAAELEKRSLLYKAVPTPAKKVRVKS